MNARQAETIDTLKRVCLPVFLAIAGLSTAAAQETVDTDKLFKEGIFLREQGQVFSAIEALETVLSNNPSLNRARLELAVAYYRALNLEQATQQSQKVLDDPKTPENVRLAVLTFLAQIKRDQAELLAKPHTWEPSVSLGVLYDTNVNVGPSGATLPGGLVLQPGSTPQHDWATVAQAGVAHTYSSPMVMRIGETAARFIWQTSAGLYHKNYAEKTDFNLTALSLSTGPAWVAPNKWRAKLNLQGDALYLGGNYLGFYSSISPTFTLQLKSGELTWDALALNKNFDRQADAGRDSNFYSTGLSYGHLFLQGKLAVQLGLHAFVEDAADSRFSNDGWETFVGANVVAWENGSVFGRYSYKEAKHDGLEPVFNLARDETENRMEVGFSHNFKQSLLKDWRLSGSWQFTDSRSNVSIYTYEREVVGVNLGRSF
jgi:tetratricopeptide (TPR) repeat protein